LLDYIRLESVDSCDVSFAPEMVTSGTLSLSLERVRVIDCATENEHSWLFADGVQPRPLWHDSCSTKSEIPYLTQLRSMMASWLNLSDYEKELPLSPGSLITLPWQVSDEHTESGQQIFQLVAHSTPEEEDIGIMGELVCVLAKDLPCLLLKSTSAVIQQPPAGEAEGHPHRISMSKRELSLNLLPPVPNIMMEEASEVATNLARYLQCFDSIILSGEIGSGKTHAALTLVARARIDNRCATLYMDCKRLQSSSDVRMKDILEALTDIFSQAVKARPCVVVLDDIDELVPNVYTGAGEDEGSAHQQQPNPVAADQAKLIGDHLQNLLENAARAQCGAEEKVFVVMTCREEQLIHPAAISQTFQRSVSVPSCSAVDREKLFMAMLRNLTVKETSSAHYGTLLQDFGSRTEGFRPRDLEIVSTRVLHKLQNHQTKTADERLDLVETVESVLDGYTPISRQGIRAEDVSAGVTWSQVGGLFRVKEYLSSTILRPVKYRRIYKHAPIRLPRGIVLFGPTGCGKSYIVPALAKVCGLTLITCRGPELLDKYIGASEAKVRQLFQRAYTAAPSLLFLDEFDALAPVRGSDSTGVTDRVVNQLLTYLDGVEDAALGSVYIVAATSRPDKVDPALLRPGRLEQHVFVGFPTSEEEWHSVLEQVLSAHEIDGQLGAEVQNRKLWEVEGAAHVRSFSPSDIKAVVDTAYLNAVHEFLASADSAFHETQDVPVVIQMHHMIKALKSTRSSLSTDDRRMLNRVYRPYITATADRPNDDDSSPAIGASRLKTALK